jgi:hypothetical protein
VISGFRREIDESCALLGCYAAISGNLLPKFQDNLLVPSSGVKNPPLLDDFGFLSPEDGTDKLSRNVGKNIPLLAA